MKVLYWSEDDGSFYHASDVDGGTEDGAPVDNYTAWYVALHINLAPAAVAIGQNDLLQVLLIHDPPLAKRVGGEDDDE